MGSHCLAWSNFPMMSAKPVLILLWLELVLPVTSVQIKEEEQMEAVLQDLVHVALSRKIKSPFFLFYLTKLYFSELTPAEEPLIRSVHCFSSLLFLLFSSLFSPFTFLMNIFWSETFYFSTESYLCEKSWISFCSQHFNSSNLQIHCSRNSQRPQ